MQKLVNGDHMYTPEETTGAFAFCRRRTLTDGHRLGSLDEPRRGPKEGVTADTLRDTEPLFGGIDR